MLKNKLFILLTLIILIMVFATAATCSMCGVEIADGDGQKEPSDNISGDSASDEDYPKDDNKTQQSSQSKDADNSKNNQGSGNQNDQQQNGGKDNQQKNNQDYNIEITDIVLGDVVDEHVEPAPFVFTDSYYTCYPVINTPLDGTETYDWGVSGGSSDNGGFYMQWNTPSGEGYYTISLNVHMGDAWGFYNEDFYVEPKTDMGPPLEGPQITGIDIIDQDSGDYVDILDVDKEYTIVVRFTDPNDLLNSIQADVNCGTIRIIVENNIAWKSPTFETDCILTVYLVDEFGDTIVQEQFNLQVKDIQ